MTPQSAAFHTLLDRPSCLMSSINKLQMGQPQHLELNNFMPKGIVQFNVLFIALKELWFYLTTGFCSFILPFSSGCCGFSCHRTCVFSFWMLTLKWYTHRLGIGLLNILLRVKSCHLRFIAWA